MRRKDESLYERLLACAGQIVSERGMGALNIRAVADRVGVSPGTVYNYFQDKGDILLALTERFWRQTLEQMRAEVSEGGFLDRLNAMYALLRERIEHSGGALMGNLTATSVQGRERMAAMLAALAEVLLLWLEQDEAVRPDAWDEAFTREQFAQFVVENVVARLRAGAADAGFLAEMVKRTLY